MWKSVEVRTFALCRSKSKVRLRMKGWLTAWRWIVLWKCRAAVKVVSHCSLVWLIDNKIAVERPNGTSAHSRRDSTINDFFKEIDGEIEKFETRILSVEISHLSLKQDQLIRKFSGRGQLPKRNKNMFPNLSSVPHAKGRTSRTTSVDERQCKKRYKLN